MQVIFILVTNKRPAKEQVMISENGKCLPPHDHIKSCPFPHVTHYIPADGTSRNFKLAIGILHCRLGA